MSETTYDEGRKVTVVMTAQSFDVPDSDIDVLLEMAGYGIAYWASSLGVVGRNVTIVDAEDDDEIFSTNYTALAQALVDIGAGKLGSGYGQYARNYLKDLLDSEDKEYAAGNIDSDLADHVVQYALFNKLVYG